MNIIDRLLRNLNQLDSSNINYNIILYLIRNADRIQGMSIYDIADACFVSTATVSRIPKLVGCKNFTEFKIALSAEYLGDAARKQPVTDTHQLIDNVLDALSGYLHGLDLAELQHAAQTIMQAERIGLFLPASLQLYALQRTLCLRKKLAANLIRLPAQERFLSTLSRGDVAVMGLVSREHTQEIRDALLAARERGVKVIAVAAADCGVSERLADILFTFRKPEELGGGICLDLFLVLLTHLCATQSFY